MILGRSAPHAQIVVLHPIAERAEALARLLRGAGHRVTVVGPGPRVVPSVAEAQPDLVIGSLAFRYPPLGAVVRSLRQLLDADLPVLVVVSRDDQQYLVGDDPEALVDADDLIREPVDAGELHLRVGGLLRWRVERRRLERRVQELLGLYRISWAFSLAGGASALCGSLARESAELFGATKGVVLLFDPEREEMCAQEPAWGLTPEQTRRTRYVVDAEARRRWSFRQNGPLLSNNARVDTRLPSGLAEELGLGEVLVAPMAIGPRQLGLLAVADRGGGAPFGEEDLNLLSAVASQAAAAVENLLLHEALKSANAQLQEFDRLKSEFVGMVAHDFRKPLMAIRGFAELVLEEAELPVETRQEYMRTVIDETDALADLADDTLLITRIETGEFAFEWGEVDLGPLILNAIPLGLAEHSVLMDVPASFPKIRADVARLRQVFNNLISNAVKYSPHGGTISVRCRERDAENIVVEVVDHGLGIPAEQVGALFQKFQRVRTPEHARIAGTGLGLYICRLIVERHGGRIWAESEPNQGSTFSFVLPRDASRVAPSARSTAAPTSPSAVPGSARPASS